jgi:hypothetical protein
MQDAQLNINKLVSLTFDENPEVRKEAARSLARHGDPAALFALVELSYDKDPSVRETAMDLLDKAKEKEPEVMSFAKIFSTKPSKKEEKNDTPSDSKEKVLAPITQLFEKRLGKERADLVREKMMPQIEKMYLKSKGPHKRDGERKVMQEFLTNYLEVISDLEQVGGAQADAVVEVHVGEGHHEDIPGEPHEHEELHAHPLESEIDEVGHTSDIDQISAEVSGLELVQQEEIREEEEMRALPDTFFKKAYEVMMLSGGDDKIMAREMKDMINRAKKEITLAFTLAKKKFKETKITNIPKLRNGMRNVNTDPLMVMAVENQEYPRTKTKKDTFTRVVVHDEEENEGVLYLFDERGTSVRPGQRIQIQRGLAKSFKFSGETALTLGKKSNVYIVL